MRHGWLTALTFLLATAASASVPAPASSSGRAPGQGKPPHAQSMDLCRRMRIGTRIMWQHHDYTASPAISSIMVAAIDGDFAGVRRGLQDLPTGQTARWRQTALFQAVLGNHPDAVRALITDGANPNGRAWIPPYTARAWQETMQAMAKEAHLGPLTKTMRKNGADMNQGMWMPPPLFRAAECGEAKVMAVLIHDGASVKVTVDAHGKGEDALFYAVLNGNTDTTRIMLDHDAYACHDDRLMARNAQRTRLRKASTLADIARKNGLPAELVARLQCHAP